MRLFAKRLREEEVGTCPREFFGGFAINRIYRNRYLMLVRRLPVGNGRIITNSVGYSLFQVEICIYLNS